jgi:hypothetical protein
VIVGLGGDPAVRDPSGHQLRATRRCRGRWYVDQPGRHRRV